MSVATIEELEQNLAGYLAEVQRGNEVLICHRDVPVARLMPLPPPQRRVKRKAGWAGDSVRVLGDLTEPCMPLEDWDMLRADTEP